jgi:hypothetical protein
MASALLAPTRARHTLVGLRLVLGVGSFLRPDLAARAFGIDPDESSSLPSAIRLFGAREAALGIGLAFASDTERAKVLMIGAGSDALDIVTVGLGGRSRRLRPSTVAIGAGLATFAVVLGLAALRE